MLTLTRLAKIRLFWFFLNLHFFNVWTNRVFCQLLDSTLNIHVLFGPHEHVDLFDVATSQQLLNETGAEKASGTGQEHGFLLEKRLDLWHFFSEHSTNVFLSVLTLWTFWRLWTIREYRLVRCCVSVTDGHGGSRPTLPLSADASWFSAFPREIPSDEAASWRVRTSRDYGGASWALAGLSCAHIHLHIYFNVCVRYIMKYMELSILYL